MKKTKELLVVIAICLIVALQGIIIVQNVYIFNRLASLNEIIYGYKEEFSLTLDEMENELNKIEIGIEEYLSK